MGDSGSLNSAQKLPATLGLRAPAQDRHAVILRKRMRFRARRRMREKTLFRAGPGTIQRRPRRNKAHQCVGAAIRPDFIVPE